MSNDTEKRDTRQIQTVRGGREHLTNSYISAVTAVSLPKPHDEEENQGVSLQQDSERGRETADQRKVHLGVISLTKFTDRGAEVEARRRCRVTGHKEDRELKQVEKGGRKQERKKERERKRLIIAQEQRSQATVIAILQST